MGKKPRKYFKNKKKGNNKGNDKMFGKMVVFGMRLLLSGITIKVESMDEDEPMPQEKQIDNIQDIDHETISTTLKNDSDGH